MRTNIGNELRMILENSAPTFGACDQLCMLEDKLKIKYSHCKPQSDN